MPRRGRMGMSMVTSMTMSMGTTTRTSTATTTERMPRILKAAAPTSAAALLQLMWLASPALPVGGFSYSEALESAVEAMEAMTARMMAGVDPQRLAEIEAIG